MAVCRLQEENRGVESHMNKIVRIVALLALSASIFMDVSFQPASTQAEDAPTAVPDQILVGFKPGVNEHSKRSVHAGMGATVLDNVYQDEVQLVQVPSGQMGQRMKAYANNPNVRFAEPNWIYDELATSNDPYYTNGSLWGMFGDDPLVTPNNEFGSQANEAWAAGYTGSQNVYVAVLDGGLDFNHPDLAANIWTNPYDPADRRDNDGNGYIDDVRGWDFANMDNSVYDRAKDNEHATHVAGTIGARGGNGVGVVGVNWNVTIIPVKWIQSGSKYGSTSASAIRAIDYVTNLKIRHRMNIVATNNSWGNFYEYSQAMSDAIERANQADILFIAGAGNGGSDRIGDNNDTAPFYPASYPHANVISVAAIDSTGNNPAWSNYGPTSVDLAAPGVDIWSTFTANRYGVISGTSMAAPHVAGAAALYASTHPGATGAEIKQAILSTTTSMPGQVGRTVTGGRLNVSTLMGLSVPLP